MFVPRSLKNKPSKSTDKRGDDTSKSIPILPPVASNSTAVKEKASDKPPPSEKDVKTERDIATLVELSVTDYALWKTPALLHLFESQDDGCKVVALFLACKWLTRMAAGLSLAALLRISPILVDVFASETQIYHALRAHGTKSLEMQLSASTDSRAHFNIRRTDWNTIGELGLKTTSEEQWNSRTVYVVSIFSLQFQYSITRSRRIFLRRPGNILRT